MHGFLWLNIKGDLFGFEKDEILGHVYFPNFKSRIFKQSAEIDQYDLLENYISIFQFKNQGKHFITDDFNSRCGTESSNILSLDESDVLFIDLPKTTDIASCIICWPIFMICLP